MGVVGLFAGIGGIELGLRDAGFETELLCEIDAGARAVLGHRFPEIPLTPDICMLDQLPSGAEIVTAGFPCQDLSQAGQLAGIRGARSGLVDHVFRLLEGARRQPTWLILENVPFMLQLDRGEAMRFLTRRLGDAGYRWAYRVVDARAFGVPQRRRRVLLVVSPTEDPWPVLFGQNAVLSHPTSDQGLACGFYWTEGRTGLGWCVDAVPTIKGGSGLGIPSPPAIWMPDGAIVTPDIRDAERLQGFEADWTEPAVTIGGLRPGGRWKLVGNAVCVPMARWLGGRLRGHGTDDGWEEEVDPIADGRWPTAAWGERRRAFGVDVSEAPVSVHCPPLEDFLRHEPAPLSQKATTGFVARLRASNLRRPSDFDLALDNHLERMRQDAAPALAH